MGGGNQRKRKRGRDEGGTVKGKVGRGWRNVLSELSNKAKVPGGHFVGKIDRLEGIKMPKTEKNSANGRKSKKERRKRVERSKWGKYERDIPFREQISAHWVKGKEGMGKRKRENKRKRQINQKRRN